MKSLFWTCSGHNQLSGSKIPFVKLRTDLLVCFWFQVKLPLKLKTSRDCDHQRPNAPSLSSYTRTLHCCACNLTLLLLEPHSLRLNFPFASTALDSPKKCVKFCSLLSEWNRLSTYMPFNKAFLVYSVELLVVMSLFNAEAKINGDEMLPKRTAFHLYSMSFDLGLHVSCGQKNLSTSLSSTAISILRNAFSISATHLYCDSMNLIRHLAKFNIKLGP